MRTPPPWLGHGLKNGINVESGARGRQYGRWWGGAIARAPVAAG
jgi:hypothetical protein